MVYPKTKKMEEQYYRPLPEGLTIKNSNIEGLGLFTTKDITVDTDLGVSHVFHVDYEDSYIRTPLGGFVNYSDNPNCITVSEYYGDLHLKTIKNIKKGEEITLKYILYNPTK